MTPDKRTEDDIRHVFESVYGQNVTLVKDSKKKALVIQRLKNMVKARESDVSARELYQQIEALRKEVGASIERVDNKVDGVSTQVANMQGRMTMIPTLISTAIGLFTFIINFTLRRQL